MGIVRKILIILGKTVACIIALAILAGAITSFSPVYRFSQPAPFSGKDIYNPYEALDSADCWKRANFHTHTKVEGIRNECDFWPEEVHARLAKLGYDIVTFSNHNELTEYPSGSAIQVNAYEHGYNLFKYHKLVFGCDDVKHFDHLLPFFASQKQFQINMLNEDSQIVQINHPLRTICLTDSQLEKLSGYKLIELDSGRSTENRYWDAALSAGHYSFGVANDDLHFPDRSSRIGVRCNYLCCKTDSWEDIKNCLLKGNFYSMRVPDYGNGNWEVKYERNLKIPSITEIGLKDSTIYMSLSDRADSIKVIGQGHTTLLKSCNTESMEYVMKADDPYARVTAYFPDGEVLYTNPFARYDSSQRNSPFDDTLPQTDILLTILFNLAVLLVCLADITAIYYILKSKK